MTVTLVDHMGSDLSIVNAARVSFAKKSRMEYICEECGTRESDMAEQQNYLWYCYVCKQCTDVRLVLRKADEGLINSLMKNRHGTPFEMVQFQFHVECPIFVAREWQRHRIGSYNEMSTRYVEMTGECYVPPLEDIRVQVGKAMNYTFEPADLETAKEVQTEIRRSQDTSVQRYFWLLERGVAKEVARNVLPLSLMTQFYWSVNLRALLNFLSLRTHPTALLEIRREAEEVEKIAHTIVPVAMDAFEKNGKVAP